MTIYKNGNSKIVNLLNDADNKFLKFATRKWYVINDENIIEHGEGNENDSCIKFETKVMKSSLFGYSDAYILVTGDITATGGNGNTSVPFKNCTPFTRCVTHINDEHIDTAENRDIIVPMYSLIKYSDNYSDTSGRLWQFKRDETPLNNNGNLVNVTVGNSISFKYKSSILEKPVAINNGVLRNVKIAVPLKCLSNF